jgi:hypothetical protein
VLESASQQQSQPKYDWKGLQSVIETWVREVVEVTIEPKLYKRQNKWALVLEEHWEYPTPPIGGSEHLDKRIEWCADKLKDWPGCKRMAYDQFWFNTKLEANKFITMYTLTWR